MKPNGTRNFSLGIAFGLILMTALTFGRVTQCAFLNFDDDLYVSENPHLTAGLSPKGIRWAFEADLVRKSPNADYWQPVTFLSRMLDISMFGFDPRGHHLTNLLIHIMNVLLLFVLLRKMTGALWRSAFVAAFFAVHPLQTEVVAWVTARKDVLSVFWGLVAIGFYLRFLKKRSAVGMGLVIFAFSMGLMSKPMLVTLPLLLLLLDFWPLKRFGEGSFQIQEFLKAVAEKWPLFFISLLMTPVPFIGQTGALTYSSPSRIFFQIGLVFAEYVGRMLLPVGLGIYGPAPEAPLVWWQCLGGWIFLAAGSAAALFCVKRFAHLFVGWFWCLAGLIPVMGLSVPADRFLYLPGIGLFLLAVWGASDLFSRRRFGRILPVLSGLCAVVTFALMSFSQVRHWRDNLSLFERAIQVNPRNYIAQNNLGNELACREEYENATAHLLRAIEIKPDNAETYNNLGVMKMRQGKWDEAMSYFSKSISLNSGFARAYHNAAEVLSKQGKFPEAEESYRMAIHLNPDYVSAYYGLGVLLGRSGRPASAAAYFSRVIELKPDFAEAYGGLGVSLAALGRYEEAVSNYEKALRFKPDYPHAYYNMGVALSLMGKSLDAEKYFREALRLNPGYEKARLYLEKIETGTPE